MKRNYMKRLVCCLAAAAMLLAVQAAEADGPRAGSPYSIIPMPARIVMAQGSYTLPAQGAKVYIRGAETGAWPNI